MIDNILQGESKTIEYKQSYTQSLLKTVSAYANFNDGVVLIGVTDNIDVIGVEHPEEMLLSIEQAINDSLEPVPYFEIEKVEYDSKVLILLKVYKGEFTPYTYKQKAYKRSGTSTVQVDRYIFEELILQGRNSSFEELIADQQDLNFQILAEKFKSILGIRNFSDDLLTTLMLKKTSGFNNAAALLSDENPLESSEIQLIAYGADNVMEIKDRQVLKNRSILEQFDKCIDFFNKHINIGEIIDGPYRKTYEEIPLVAYREAVSNLIVHRDYSRAIAGRIEIFSDRIELISPGGLPIGITEEEYLDGRISVARNRILADIFLKLKIIEKMATGVRRIKQYYKESNKKPEFLIAENSILVVLPKVERNKDEKIEQFKRISATSEKEKMIYEIIRAEGPIGRAAIEKKIGMGKSQTIELINQLRSIHLITHTGKGPTTKYIITPGER
ncbi:MAG: RNA-binding domain-containing protein [Anaerovoracaceae bacterium]|jgi:ATP-dependent DNA helicase RecG